MKEELSVLVHEVQELTQAPSRLHVTLQALRLLKDWYSTQDATRISLAAYSEKPGSIGTKFAVMASDPSSGLLQPHKLTKETPHCDNSMGFTREIKQ